MTCKHVSSGRLPRSRAAAGFSLVELMAAMTILLVLMLLLTQLMTEVQRSWRFGEDRIGQFREARVAFDLVTKNIAQASMSTYWDYKKDEDGNVLEYIKKSHLHFYSQPARKIESKLGLTGRTNGHAVFFQAPLGFSVRYRNLSNLFNGRGYLVVHGSDEAFRPSFVVNEKIRFRLMEFRPPAEDNQVFKDGIDEYATFNEETGEFQPMENGGGEPSFDNWWNQGMKDIGTGDFQDHLNPLAENIILLVVAPLESIDSQSMDRLDAGSAIAPNYELDSNRPLEEQFGHQVPPLVQVTMVAIDETTAVALEARYGDQKPDIIPSGLFQNVKNYGRDIEVLTERFNEHNENEAEKINYRVFNTIVMLRAAKWSEGNP